MSHPEKVPVLLTRPCHYTLPDDLKFATLAPGLGEAITCMRFVRRNGTVLDLPVSAEVLCDLVRTLHPLFGNHAPDEIQAELSDLVSNGLLPFESE